MGPSRAQRDDFYSHVSSPTNSKSELVGPFPGEHPVPVDLKQWIDTATPYVTDKKWSALVNGKTPASLLHLADKDLTLIPELTVDGTAGITGAMVESRKASRASWTHDNTVNAATRDQYMLEMNDEFAQWIAGRMRDSARLRLTRLQTAHRVGTTEYYNGAAMWKDILALAKESITHEDADDHKDSVDAIKADKLPEGCHVQDYTDKVNTVLRDHNDYLETPYAGSLLSHLFLDMLPPSLASDKRALKRELAAATSASGRTIDDHSYVLQQCEAIVKSAARKGSVPSTINGMCASVSAPGAFAGPAASERAPSKRAAKKAARQAAGVGCALLPDGKWCKAGTCHRDHDITVPGSVCFSNPAEGGGILPRRMSDNSYKSLLINRADIAKKKGVVAKPIWRKGETGPPAAIMAAAFPESGPFEQVDEWGNPTLGNPALCQLSADEAMAHENVAYALVDVDPGEASPARAPNSPCAPGAPPVVSVGQDPVSGPPPQIASPVDKVWCVVIGGKFEGPEAVDADADSRAAYISKVELTSGYTSIKWFGNNEIGQKAATAYYTAHVMGQLPSGNATEAARPAHTEVGPGPDVPWGGIAASVGACVIALVLICGVVQLCVTTLPVLYFACAARLGFGTAMRAQGLDNSALVVPNPSPALSWNMMRQFALILAMIAWGAHNFLSDGLALYSAFLYCVKAARRVRNAARRLNPMRMLNAVAPLIFIGLVFYFADGASGDTTADAARVQRVLSRLPALPAPARYSLEVAIYDKYNVANMMNLVSDDDATALQGAFSECFPVGGGRLGPDVRITDSGARDHNLTSAQAEKYAIPGSWRANTTVVNTANGQVLPPWRCDARLPVRFANGKRGSILLRNAFVNDACQYVLVSTGKLASEGVGTWHAPVGGDSFLLFPGGAKVSLIDMGVLILPDPNLPPDALPRYSESNLAVVQGGRIDKHATWGVLHDTFLHRSPETIGDLHRCTSDGRAEWKKPSAHHPEACDSCLRATADAVGSTSESPKATTPGEFVGMDVWSVSVPHVHGGQKKVIGFHDYYSTLTKYYLIHNETSAECAVALGQFIAYCKSHGVTIKRIHTDNAQAFVGDHTAMQKLVNEHCIRLTTISPKCPRQNGKMERCWRTCASDVRKGLDRARMPRSWWWYFFFAASQIQGVLPIAGSPDECPLSRFTGEKPTCGWARPTGCLGYPKLFDPVSKVHNQSTPCIHLCRSQSGYMMYDPESGRIYTTPHVRFVPEEFPGIAKGAGDKRFVQPSFAPDYDPAAELEQSPVPPRCALDADLLENDPAAPPAVPHPTPARTVVHAPHTRTPPAASPPRVGAIAGRVREAHARDHVGAVATDEPKCSQGPKGGTAHGAELEVDLYAALKQLHLDVPQDKYFIYLGCGARRPGDIAERVAALSDCHSVLMIDTIIGGDAHDMTAAAFSRHILTIASSPRCMGVLATIPCSTWSVVRFREGTDGPPPVRIKSHPLGIPNAYGELPPEAVRANRCADVAAAAATACCQHGGCFIFENPCDRGEGSLHAIAGREKHSSLWSHPSVAHLAEEWGSYHTFDQCMVGANTEKKTTLLVSRSLTQHVAATFGPLQCNHPPHDTLGGKTDGIYNTKTAACFPPKLNDLIARALIYGSTATWPSRASATSSSVLISEAFTSYLASAPSNLSGWLYRSGSRAHLGRLRSLLLHFGDAVNAWGGVLDSSSDLLLAMGPFSTKEKWTMYETCVDGQFHVTQLNMLRDENNPSYSQASNGPEKKQWETAMNKEVDTLRNHGTIKNELPEDSLPTWNAAKGRAFEVINSLWVLVKRFGQLGELLKYKGRCVMDGGEQKRKATALEKDINSFSPTPRNCTFKGLCCSAVLNKACIGSFDFEAAYLHAKPTSATPVYVRPPPGFQFKDHRGIPIVWELGTSLYGDIEASRAFYLTVISRTKDEQNFNQSDYDPCHLWKTYDNGERIDLCSYVDDGIYVVRGIGGSPIPDSVNPKDLDELAKHAPNAAAELRLLAERFTITFLGKPKLFLGMDIDVQSSSRIKISAHTYVTKQAAKLLPMPLENYPKFDTPGSEALTRAYERAALREHDVCPILLKRYKTKIGALLYAPPCGRADCCWAISMLSRCATFPTQEMDLLADRVLVYMAQNSDMGETFDGTAEGADVLHAFCDSDWSVLHSMTGFCLMLCGAALLYCSKRQQAIALSSTEAEVMAASQAASELVYTTGMLAEMGIVQNKSPVLYVDNSGALALAKDRRSCHKSKHIDRRYLKVREWVEGDYISVEKVHTDENPADIFTKYLPLAKFEKFCKMVMGI